MTSPALEVKNLSFSWDTSPVFENVSFSVNPKETVCIIGKSGCGKSSLFHVLSGLEKPSSGNVFLYGKDITAKPGNISYMLQKDLLLPNKRIIDNVCLPLKLKGKKNSEARNEALPLLERFGLLEVKDAWPNQLSGGMRQRAAFLRTYLSGNKVFLLDEPFSALDALTRKDLRGWFVDILSNIDISTIMITHDIDEALLVADRIYVLQGFPNKNIPSKIVANLTIERPDDKRDLFEFDSNFLHLKKEIFHLLESN